MKYCIVLSVFLSSIQLSAQYTYVYFQNNTYEDFSITTSSAGGLNGGDWDGYNGSSVALKSDVEVQNFRRDAFTSSSSGTYFITSTITFPTGETVELKIKYDINFLGTGFEVSSSGPGFSDPWFDDENIHDQFFTVNGKNYVLRYQSYFTLGGVYNDVDYAIYYDTDPEYYVVNPADDTNTNVLNVMSYNVFLRPTILFPDDNQDVRSDYIPNFVHDMDVIMFQEVFDNNVRLNLLNLLAPEYPYQSSVVDDPGNALEDGGVLFVSKWPIETEGQELFGNNCVGEDCVSNKGIKYVRINKLGKKYHLFSTHMDSFNDPADIAMRKTQLVQWSDYITSLAIPSDEPVLMGGDFNIDRYSNKLGEYDSLFGNFGAHLPIYSGLDYSWDTQLNHYLKERTEVPELLDYIFAHQDYGTLISDTNTTLLTRTNHPDLWQVYDLSDHQAIWGRFEYTVLLAVELLEFNATYVESNSTIQLNWSTTSEIDNDFFTVERSLDGVHFDNIAEINGTRESRELLYYSYKDNNFSPTLIYYRLKMTDYSGKETFSEIISINAKQKGQFSLLDIYPNPVSISSGGEITIRLEAKEDLMLNYSIFDGLGRQVYTKKNIQAIVGENLIKLTVNTLPVGIYNIQLNDQDSTLAKNFRFVVSN